MSLKYAYIRKTRFKEIKYDLLALKLISDLVGIQTQISMTNIESTYGINQNSSYWLSRGIYKIVLKEEFSWIQIITSQESKDLCWNKMKEEIKIVWKGLSIASYHSNIGFLFLYLVICRSPSSSWNPLLLPNTSNFCKRIYMYLFFPSWLLDSYKE